MGVTQFGRICSRHPELNGKRYTRGGCIGCQRDNRRQRYLKATRKSQEAEPARNAIRSEIEEEVMEMRRTNAIEILREERRRQLLRDEIPTIRRRWW
jgi:hypothetical protein